MARGRTALITGVFGQDGQLLARRLLVLGYRVIGVARPPCDPPAPPLDQVRLVTVELADRGAVNNLLGECRPDEVYHLAATHHSSQQNSDSSELATKESMLVHNFLSTSALAFGLVDLKSTAHLVFAASSQMYTPHSPRDEVSEKTPRRPRTFYGFTKSWSMDVLAFLRAESGLRASTAILFNHESPLRSPQFVTRKISQAAARAKRGETVRLDLLNIGARVDWSSAADVVTALHLMAGQAEGRDFVVASGELHSVRELLEIAFGHVGLDWRRYTEYQFDSEEPALVGNSRALRETLGWQPSESFRDLVTGMVEYDLERLTLASTEP